jgi:hypothetical protein
VNLISAIAQNEKVQNQQLLTAHARLQSQLSCKKVCFL